MNRRTTLVALLALAATPALAQEVVGRKETTFTLSESVARDGWVRIASFNGNVSIAQGSGDKVEVRAEKIIRKGEVEDVGFVVRRGAEGLTVCAVYNDDDECDKDGNYRGFNQPRNWWRDHQSRVNFTVRIPAGVKVRAGSGNGDVSITGAGSEVVASTGNGRVDVSGTKGQVNASTGNGKVTIEGAEGPVEVSSGNGDIRVVTSTGPVSANSGNGDIDVSIGKLDASPDMDFSTGNGRVTLTLPDGFGAEVNAHTGSGSVVADFPIQVRGRIDPTRLRGVIGKGGGRLEISSGNGDVEIRKKP